MKPIHLVLVLATLLTASLAPAQISPAPAAAKIVNVQGQEILVNRATPGRAPTIHEIMRSYPPPQEYGQPERAIVNPSVDEPLLSRDRVPDLSPDPIARPFLPEGSVDSLLSFGGYDSSDNTGQGLPALFPPDTEGDVGIDYYVQYNNVGWKYFNKSDGSLAGGPFPGNSFWQGSSLPPASPCVTDNAGDPIVLFDHLAERWVFSQFVNPFTNTEGHQCFAISDNSDPAGPYTVYDFIIGPMAPNAEFNDYEKIGLWSDAAGNQSSYHMSSNQFNLPGLNQFLGVRVTAFDRDVMLAGNVATSIEFFKGLNTDPSAAGHVPFSFQPAHLEGDPPPADTCAYYIQLNDDVFTGLAGSVDGFQFWQFCVDFATPGNATFTEGPQTPSASFALPIGINVPQPGTGVQLDVLDGRAMYRFNTRLIGGLLRGAIAHDVLVSGTHSVRYTTFTLPNLAGVSLDDEGSLSPPDTQSRWMPGAGMDSEGNVALVYSRSGAGAGEFPSVYFAGRETTDPAGTLQPEVVCVDGTGVQTGTQSGRGRWGDYATVSVDPVDQCTFWVTNEYVETTGSVDWDTQICSYRFPSCEGGVIFTDGFESGDTSAWSSESP